MGKHQKQSRNANRRANGDEPAPGPFAGMKRWARYHRQTLSLVIVKNPAKYLNASSRVSP